MVESLFVKLKSMMGKTHTQFKILTSERVLTITTVEHNVLSGYKKHNALNTTIHCKRLELQQHISLSLLQQMFSLVTNDSGVCSIECGGSVNRSITIVTLCMRTEQYRLNYIGIFVRMHAKRP